jgi:hypothetical protein
MLLCVGDRYIDVPVLGILMCRCLCIQILFTWRVTFLYYGDPREENRQRMWDTLQSCTDNAGMTNIRLEDERRDMQASASASETRNACGRPD